MTLNELLTDPEIIEALQELVSERRRRKGSKSDAGSPQDTSRDTVGNRASYMTTAEDRRTFGGLYEPVEDDRTPSLVAEYFGTQGGLFTPDRDPSVEEKLRALWFEPRPTIRIAPTRTITAEEHAYRETSGGMLTPE